MKEIYFVTGNPGKMQELRALFPGHMELKSRKLDLPEIQSMDSEVIVRDKLERAFAIVGQPVIVDDVAVAVSHLNGLPGPFIKYFEEGLDAEALWKLSRHADDRSVVASCIMGYYDGQVYHIVRGEVAGEAVAPRGTNGFGFDTVFLPNGETRTFAELSTEEKNRISHRALASKKMIKFLSSIV